MRIERIWAMPNKWTFTILPIKQLLSEELTEGTWVDGFAGQNSPAAIKNDLNPDNDAHAHMDALEFFKKIPSGKIDGVLYDPPYSITQAAECYQSFGKDKFLIPPTRMDYWAECKNEIARMLKPGGKAMCFGWSTNGLGIKRGFEMTRILIVAHGGSKNDTLCTVEIKK